MALTEEQKAKLMAKSSTKKCANCGDSMPATAAFCPSCGAPVQTVRNVSNPQTNDGYIAMCRPHWAGYVKSVFVMIIMIVAGCFTFNSSRIIAALLFLQAVCIVIGIIIDSKTTYIALTGRKIVAHVGFINSKTLSTPLSKVQNIGLSNGLLGKLFGYHTILISDAGTSGTEYKFPRMANAIEFVNAVQDRME